MTRKSCALAWLLGFALAVPCALEAQQPAPRRPVDLQQNYPNPFNPATTIPFRVPVEWFNDGHRPVVSLRVFNVLAQLVAIPSLQASGQPLDNLALECREVQGDYCIYSAYWDGKYINSTREAASGVYVYQLVIDGQRQSRRMIVMK